MRTSLATATLSRAFPRPSGGPYIQIAATRRVACALSAAGEVVCLRRDGQVVSSPPGHYTFIEAGRATLCALRLDGTASCWHHDGDESTPTPYRDVTRFDELALPLNTDW